MRNKLAIALLMIFIAGIIAVNIPNLLRPLSFHTPSDIRGWGSNFRGQLGPLGYGLYDQPVRSLPLPESSIKQFAVGADYEVFLDNNGQVWSLGQPVTSLEGDRFVVESEHLRHVIYQDPGVPLYEEYKMLPKMIEVAASNQTTLALDETGRVWGWGSNLAGQLGDREDHIYVPVIINELTDVVDIELGYKFALAKTKDGSVYGWGAKCTEGNTSEAYSALNILLEAGHDLSGLGGYFDPNTNAEINAANTCVGEGIVGFTSRTPVRLQISDVVGMSAGFGHSLFLKSDGTVWGVGCNLYGQVGVGYTGNKDDNLLPMEIKGIANITQISAGFRHSLAIDKDGNTWAWGHNRGGQLGDNKTETADAPVKLDAKFKSVTAAHDNSIAIDAAGKLWGWGENHGRIFAIDGDKFLTPTQLTVFTEPVTAVKLGLLHTIIQK